MSMDLSQQVGFGVVVGAALGTGTAQQLPHVFRPVRGEMLVFVGVKKASCIYVVFWMSCKPQSKPAHCADTVYCCAGAGEEL